MSKSDSTIRIDTEQKEHLAKIREIYGVPVAVIVRRALAEFFVRHNEYHEAYAEETKIA